MTDYLTTTQSTCRECGRLIPAQVHVEPDGVWFHKHCPEHGPQQAMVWSQPDSYLNLAPYFRPGWMPLKFSTDADQGCPQSCGLCPQHEQHVCLPIIEITDHCDLACPVCLVKNRASFHLTPRQVADMLDRLIASEGKIDVVNLSGGEPLLNPHFRQIVEQCLSRSEILRLSVSTNGLALIRDPSLLQFLARLNVIISLQFDGWNDQAYIALRGRPLAAEKRQIIEMATDLDAPMSLTATLVAGINQDCLGDVADLLFSHDNILSTSLQPAAFVGQAARLPHQPRRLTIPDVIHGLHGRFGGQMSTEDFSPLPCCHPACYFLAFYLKVGDGRFLPLKQLVNADRYLDIIQNRAIFGTDPESFSNVREAVYELWSGSSALAPDSQKALVAVKHLLAAATSSDCCYRAASALSAAERSIKSVFVHHFMDRETFDLSRARKCCQVYPQPDGRLIPACVHNCLRR